MQHIDRDSEGISATSTVAGFPLYDEEKSTERNDQLGISIHAEPGVTTIREPSIVDWEGQDDPENPLNWSFSKKATGICIVSAITFVRYANLHRKILGITLSFSQFTIQ